MLIHEVNIDKLLFRSTLPCGYAFCCVESGIDHTHLITTLLLVQHSFAFSDAISVALGMTFIAQAAVVLVSWHRTMAMKAIVHVNAQATLYITCLAADALEQLVV